ncbi:hypothetical protein Pst134EB_023238 [Puccinia striiformis f. sp. tritici]|nr:hypothetical protein Pst134EB_023238 [Puccinia striiformis f. sp. tritici]
MAPVTRNGASSSNAGSPAKKPNGSLHKNAEVADTAGQLFGGSFTGPEAWDALNRILERSSQVDLTPQGDSGQPERGFGGLQEARDLPDSSNSALNVPMELDATLGGTSNPVSVLVVIRTWRKALGSAQNRFHHRSRNMRDSVCWPKLTSANRWSLSSLQALADLDPTLQGSVEKEIPTPFTQVDFVQDGRSHEVGNPAATAKENISAHHISGVDLTGVGIAASETTLEAAQVPALSATATLQELKQMYTSYAATKESIEKSIEGHSGSTAPYLKVFMNTTLKGLNAFLVECKKRIDSADSNQDMDLSIIDLTLDDNELEVIRPLKRTQTPFSSIKFKKGAPASAPTPPVLKKLKIAASAPSAAPLFKPSSPPEVSGDSADEIADEELEEVICGPNDSAARAQRTSPPPTRRKTLVDMVKELSHPGTSLAYNGQQAQHIDLPANFFPMPKGVRADWGDMLWIAQGLPKRERGADEVDPEPKKKVKSAKKTTVPIAVGTPGSQVQVEDGPSDEEVDRMVNELGEHLDDTFPNGEPDGDQRSDNGEEDSDHGDEEQGRRLAESQFVLNSVSVAK